MNQKLLITSFLFFLIVLVNPRDFPFPNVPLIYPAFVIALAILGIRRIVLGIKRTLSLQLLIVIYWCYLTCLRNLYGYPLKLGDIPYLIEPLVILVFAGSVASFRNDGAKIGTCALVGAISLSSGLGLWIHFIGEPIKSLYSMVQKTSTGTIIDIATKTYGHPAVNGRAGLANSAFLFSYQNAVALSLIVTNFMDPKRSLIKNYLIFFPYFAILFLEMIVCAERATVGSVLIGVLFYMVLAAKRVVNFKSIFSILFVSIIAVFLIQYSSSRDSNNLQHRSLNEAKLTMRLLVMPMTAIETIYHQPFGAGTISHHYEKVARKKGYYKNGHPIGAHNHYANIIMYTGIVGIILTSVLFILLTKKILMWKKINDSGIELIIASACVTSLVHATSHNAGFFKLEPATLIIFGLLWGIIDPRSGEY